MSNRRLVRLLSLAVVAGGGMDLLATPASASTAAFACDDAAWSDAVNQASAACGSGHASIVGRCVGTKVFVEEIFCY